VPAIRCLAAPIRNFLTYLLIEISDNDMKVC